MSSIESIRARRGRRIRWVFLYLVLSALSALFLLPYYVIVRNAVGNRADITGIKWTWFPSNPQWHNISDLLTGNSSILRGLGNSAIVAVIQVALMLAIGAAAGYGLARIRYRHRNVVFASFLVTLMVPSAVTFIPTFVVVAKLGLVNTLAGIILPGIFNVFTVFIYRQFFLDFPTELEEAARVDGLGHWGTFLRIVMPNSVGVTIALGSIAFINSWNAFLWPLVIGQDQTTWTVQVVVSTYLNSYHINLPALFAASLLAILPLMVLFFIFQRYIVQGVKFSGVKG